MKECGLLVLLLLLFSATPLFAIDRDAIGQVKNVVGPAYIMRGTETIPAIAGMKIVRSDMLITGVQGAMGVVFHDNSTLSLGADTEFQLSRYEFNVLEKKVGFVGRIRHGTMVFLSGLITKMNANATRFETPVAVAGIRGTKLAIIVKREDKE